MGQVQNFGTGHDADEETKRGQQMIFQGEKMIAQNEKMLKQIRFAISIAILALAVGVIGLIATFVLHYEP
jgi:ABC-type antimicrobial peptide transport system permease subunit